MAFTLAQRAELETVVSMLRHGEKPNISPAVNRRIVRVLRDAIGDLSPGSDNVAFDERPVRSLIEALLAVDTAWACPECPECEECPPPGGTEWPEPFLDWLQGITTLAGSLSISSAVFGLQGTTQLNMSLQNLGGFDFGLVQWPNLVLVNLLDFSPSGDGILSLDNMDSLASVNLTEVILGVGGLTRFAIVNAPNLQSINPSSFSWLQGSSELVLSECALTEAAVNALLVYAEQFIVSVTDGYICTSGGTSAAPTGAGATAKTALINAGWSVVTN